MGRQWENGYREGLGRCGGLWSARSSSRPCTLPSSCRGYRKELYVRRAHEVELTFVNVCSLFFCSFNKLGVRGMRGEDKVNELQLDMKWE